MNAQLDSFFVGTQKRGRWGKNDNWNLSACEQTMNDDLYQIEFKNQF